MNFTSFAILIYLWSRPSTAAAFAALQDFTGDPATNDRVTELVQQGLITFDGQTVTLQSGTTPDIIVSLSASVLNVDEQAAVVALMQAAVAVPTGETFLADTRAAGYSGADAARGALFSRVCAALASKRGDDRLVSTAGRAAQLSDRAAAALA
jgi:hypothetical protein